MAIWIINQGFQPVKITRITIQSQITFRRADLYRFSGSGPEDPNPRWGWIRGMPIESNRTGGLSCSPVSVSVLSLQR
jgi:hypothetical protein